MNSIHPTNVNTAMIHNDATYQLFRPDLEISMLDDALEGFASITGLPIAWVEPRCLQRRPLPRFGRGVLTSRVRRCSSMQDRWPEPGSSLSAGAPTSTDASATRHQCGRSHGTCGITSAASCSICQPNYEGVDNHHACTGGS